MAGAVWRSLLDEWVMGMQASRLNSIQKNGMQQSYIMHNNLLK